MYILQRDKKQNGKTIPTANKGLADEVGASKFRVSYIYNIPHTALGITYCPLRHLTMCFNFPLD